MAKAIDMTGKKIGRLTVIRRAEDAIRPSGYREVQWYCRCDCGNFVIVTGKRLRSGNTKSCGCLFKEIASSWLKKKNKYDLESKEYGIGYTSNTNEPFYFDLEDYDKIKNYCWFKSNKGYVVTSVYMGNNKNKTLGLHSLVMDASDDIYVDHIRHNKLDNRKSELRFINSVNNERNSKLSKNNTSGVTGVTWHSRDNVWQARIKVNYKYIHLGYFDKFEDAVAARKQAEEKYFGEYSYDNSMKKGSVA